MLSDGAKSNFSLALHHVDSLLTIQSSFTIITSCIKLFAARHSARLGLQYSFFFSPQYLSALCYFDYWMFSGTCFFHYRLAIITTMKIFNTDHVQGLLLIEFTVIFQPLLASREFPHKVNQIFIRVNSIPNSWHPPSDLSRRFQVYPDARWKVRSQGHAVILCRVYPLRL